MAKKRTTKSTKKTNEIEFPWITTELQALAVPIGDLQLDPQNARTHDEQNVRAVMRSLRREGQYHPLIVDAADNQVVIGNCRLIAARRLKWSHVAAIRRPMTPAERARLSLQDNRTGELGDWDLLQLEAALGTIEQDDFDQADILRLQLSFDELLEKGRGASADGPLPDAPEPQVDRAEELRKKWGVESGQLWLIDGKAGTHRVLCGDSTKADNWESIALVVTSPPYPGADMWNERDEQGKADNAERLLVLGFDVLALACGHAAVVAWNVGDCSTGKAEMLPTGANVIQWARERGHLVRWAIWDKGIINPLPPQSFMRRPVVQHITHEWIITIYPNGWQPREKQCGLADGTHEWQMRSVWTIAPEHASKIGHKAPFPVRLAERCISLWSLEGDTVFDPFLGSGTTLAACEQLGRIGVGIEIEPKYVAVALQRLADMGLEPRLQG